MWIGALDGARKAGADMERALDCAQSVACATLQALARGASIRDPRGYGRLAGRREYSRASVTEERIARCERAYASERMEAI